jgi:Tfp pilus assembly protein PilX
MQRRGAAIAAIILALLLIGLVGVGMVLGGARDQDLSIQRLETVRAFYAAEAGMNMAMREMMLSSDADGDGAVGTISNDGNSENDPSVGSGRVNVTSSVAAGTTTLSSNGRSGQAKRKIDAALQ